MTSKINIGTDVVEIQRFRRKPLGKNRSFYDSLFTRSELSYCIKYADPYTHFAGIFAAKEAVIKCLDESVRMTDIEIFWNNRGKPKVAIRDHKKNNTSVSISHTRSIALAVVVILL